MPESLYFTGKIYKICFIGIYIGLSLNIEIKMALWGKDWGKKWGIREWFMIDRNIIIE